MVNKSIKKNNNNNNLKKSTLHECRSTQSNPKCEQVSLRFLVEYGGGGGGKGGVSFRFIFRTGNN